MYQDVYVYIVVNASRAVLGNSQKIKELVLMCNHSFKKSKKAQMNCGFFAGCCRKSIGPLNHYATPIFHLNTLLILTMYPYIYLHLLWKNLSRVT
jgi:hypothetical protein